MYQLVLRFARRLAAKPDKTGIMQISNKQEVIDAANDILTKFKKHKVPNEAIQSENDVKVIYNQIIGMENQTFTKNLKTALTPQKTGDVLDLTGKKIDTSKPILGGKNVPETEAQIKTKLEGMNKKTVERIRRRRYEAALKAEREKMAKDEFYIPKILDPDDFAYGGLAGMLGERTGYQWGGPGGKSPGTRADYTPGQGHRERVGGPPGGGDPGMTYTAGPSTISDKVKEPPYIPEPITSKIEKQVQKKINPFIKKTEQKQKDYFFNKKMWENLEKYKTLSGKGRKDEWWGMQKFEETPFTSKNLLDKFFTEISIKYPNIKVTDEFGYVNKNKAKQVIDKAVLDGNLSIGDSFNISRTLDTMGEGITGINLDTEHFTASGLPEKNKYTVGSQFNIGDVDLGYTGNIQGDDITQQGATFDYGDGTFTGGIKKDYDRDYTLSELGLDKTFDLNDLAKLNIKGDISQRSDQDFTTSSLTPKLNIDYGNVSANIAKNIIEGGTPTVDLGLSYPFEKTIQGDLILDAQGKIQFDDKGNVLREPNKTINTGGTLSLSASDLLSKDRSALLGYSYEKGSPDSIDPYFGVNLNWDPIEGDKNLFFGVKKQFAGGGLAGMLGEPTYADDNHRVPLGGGKFVFDAARRKFLQMMGVGAAGVGAAKSGLFGLLKGGGKKQIVESLTQVPIKAGVDGMPVWFKPLVNRVIKEGDDVSKRFATQERQIVHKTELPDSKTDVIVTQDLNTGNVSVELGMTKHGFADGKFGQPVRLEYKAGEVIEPTIKKGKEIKGTKTKDEFWVEEAEFTGGHPENVKFEESSFNKFGKHESNFDEVEAFAKGKIKKTRKISSLQKEGEDLADHFSNYPTPDDFASGGRVPMIFGGSIGLKALIKRLRGGSKTLFPKIKKDQEGLGRLIDPKTMESIESLNLQQLENVLEALKIDKRSMKHIAETKAMKDPGLDFLMGKMKEDKSFGLDFDHLAKYTDIDNDIMVVEQMIKNKTMKQGRKPNATGGRVPFAAGKGVMSLLKLLQKKFPGTTKLGQTSRPMAPKTELKKSIADFLEREKASKLKIWENPDKVRAAVDDIFSTGDYKYDAEMAAEALVENNPAAFGGKLIDDIDEATRSEIYGAVLRVVQSDLAKTLQLKKLSRPTKTLEGIEKTGTINISDPNVADEFTRFMKESDPKGHKKIEEIVEITNFDPKGRKKNASGGLAGMLGE